jgi:large subunit ribosomal protein L33
MDSELAVGDDPTALSNEGRTMAGDNREYVFLECTETGMRYYRTEKRVKGMGVKKIELKKYNSKLRKHTVHKERKK